MSAQPEVPEPSQLFEMPGDRDIKPGVVEFLGMEKIMRIEGMAAEVQAWQAIAQSADPFKDTLRLSWECEDSILPDTDSQAILEAYQRAKHIAYNEDPANDEVIQVTRTQAPILAKTVLEGRNNLDMRADSLSRSVDETGSEAHQRMEADPAHLGTEETAELYDRLVKIASQFPAQREVQQLAGLAATEILLRMLDARVCGAKNDPALAQKYMQSARNAATPNEILHQMAKQHMDKLSYALRQAGSKDPGLDKSHRSYEKMIEGEELIKSLKERLDFVKTEGSMVHRDIVAFARGAVVRPADELATAVARLKEANTIMLETERADLPQDKLEERQAQCLDIEHYLAGHAQATLTALKAARANPDIDMRRSLQALSEESLQQAYENEQKARARQVGAVSITKEVAPDTEFRKTCSRAKRIVDGGVHLNHPKASQLAQELHRTELGEKEKIRLDRQEQGIVVAILTTGLSPLLDAIERVQGGDGTGLEAQVRLLRQQAPEQFRAISSLDFRGSVTRLKGIFDNPFCRNQLRNPLTRSGFEAVKKIEQVRRTVNELAEQFETPPFSHD